MARFALRAAPSLIWGWRLVVPFYSVQDCGLNRSGQV